VLAAAVGAVLSGAGVAWADEGVTEAGASGAPGGAAEPYPPIASPPVSPTPPIAPVAAPAPVVVPPTAPLPASDLLGAPAIASAEEEPLPAFPRPGFAISAALGVSIDNAGIADGRNVAIPSFTVQGGIGQGRLGFDARLFASEAAGQFATPSQVTADNKALIADVGADRQAVDLMLAVRPFATWRADTASWSARFVRLLTVDVGAGGERLSVGAKTVFRLGAVLAAYADFPITPATDTSALHLRLTARRMFSTKETIALNGQSSIVGDTKIELFGGLAVLF
jgi:hypothetical protein